MVAAAPSYDDILSTTISAMQSTAVISVGGQRVMLDMSPGGGNLELAVAIAINVAALYGRQDQIVAALDFAQAQGLDLERIVALLGVLREPAVAATKPFLVGRQSVTATTVTVPVGFPFVVTLADGTTRRYDALRGINEAPGTALTLGPGVGTAWVLASDEAVAAGTDPNGSAGNIPAGATVQLGDSLPWCDIIGDPPCATPLVPTATVVGGATRTRYYRIVGNGVTGKTLPSGVLTVTTAPTTLDATHHVDLAFGPGTDGGTTPPLSYDVLASDDNVTFVLLGTTTGTTLSDTGMIGTPYTLMVQNTSNSGVGGVDEESDEQLRQRAPTTIAARSVATGDAVAAKVANVDGVTAAYSLDVAPGLGTVNVVTDVYPPSATTLSDIDDAIDQTAALGAQITPNIVVPTVVSVAYTLIADSSTVTDPTALYTPVNTAIIAALAGLALGAPVHFSGVITAIMSVTGVVAVQALSLTVGSNTYSGVDAPGSPLVVYRTDSDHITPAHA